MYLEVTCPVCKASQRLSLDGVGQQYACSVCSSSLTVANPGHLAPELQDAETETTLLSESATNTQVTSDANKSASPKVLNANPETLNFASGIGLIIIGCGQLLYSLNVILQTFLAVAAGLGKVAIMILLACFAIIPDGTSGGQDTIPDPVHNVVMPVILLGNALAIFAIGGGLTICKNPGAGKLAAIIVAVCSALLFLMHLVAGLEFIAMCYLLTTVLAVSYVVRNSSAAKSEMQMPE